jgi:hypothetical protein
MFPEYVLETKITDEEKLALQYFLSIGTDKLEMSNNVGVFRPDTTKLGIHKISFSATDGYQASSTAVANITVFDNLPPVALFTAFKLGVFDLLEYKIDASSSYDGDLKFGGKIVEYEFIINTTYKVNTGFNNINYIFPSAGNYTVSVRVKDDNNAWSVAKVIVLTVN